MSETQGRPSYEELAELADVIVAAEAALDWWDGRPAPFEVARAIFKAGYRKAPRKIEIIELEPKTGVANERDPRVS